MSDEHQLAMDDTTESVGDDVAHPTNIESNLTVYEINKEVDATLDGSAAVAQPADKNCIAGNEDADGVSDMLGNIVNEDSEDEDLNYSDNYDETDDEIDAYAYASSDAESEVSDAFSDFGRERVNCKQFYIPEYLRHYYPEDTDEDSSDDEENEYSKSNSVKSFLILGELCENLIEYVKTILKKGTRGIDSEIESGIFRCFYPKIETIQRNCVKKAKESLERVFMSKMPRLATDIVFENLFKGEDDWKNVQQISKFEELSDAELVVLRKTFKILGSIYGTIREIGHRGFCPIHYDAEEFYYGRGLESLVEDMRRFKIDPFWSS